MKNFKDKIKNISSLALMQKEIRQLTVKKLIDIILKGINLIILCYEFSLKLKELFD
jgi:hypothetical protein